MSPRSARRRCSSNTCETSPWSRIAMMWPPCAVASSYQLRDPWPIYLEGGSGPRVWDVDGNEMYDFHNGFGSMVQGHAHPAIGDAIRRRYERGTHFAAPTEDAVVVAEELQRRWSLPRWRYTNSGSESTMDAIRIARAYTRRDTVMKIFGSYHGHHDTVMVSIGVEYDQIGDRENLASLPYGAGIPQAVVDLTIAVPFNAAGGATEKWGVRSDMVTLAKALGGGLPSGAIGGSEEVMSVVEDGSVFQVGTYNGNPLGMAAARANLTEVLTPDAYKHLDALNDRILEGCTRVIEKYNLPGYAVGIGSKGCVTFSTVPVVDYESFKANQDADVSELAWLFNMNRGVFMTPGREEEWTLSVMHDDASVDCYVQVFESMADELT